MTLTGIANAVNPQDPSPLLKHLSKEQYQLSGEFSPPMNVMKRFVKFAVNKGGLRLEFDRAAWENNIVISPKAKTLTINNLTEDIIAAINEELGDAT